MAADVGDAALRSRQLGGLKTGTVSIRSFDQGVVETLKSVAVQGSENLNYYIPKELIGVEPSPNQPGVQVIFAFPEDIYEKWKKPCIMVSRDDLAPAMQRWHPGAMQYNAPATSAGTVVYNGVSAPSKMETMAQATPIDLQYTISILSVNRTQANKMLEYVLKIFPPYAAVFVKDSIGDQRTYSAWMDGVSMLDELADVSDRTIGFGVALRVEAEFDLADPETHTTVTGRPTLNMQRK